MATVRCPVDTFERGGLPSVCVFTGDPADGSYAESFESKAGAQYFLLLLGLVPFLVVRMVTRKTASGKLPVSQAAFTERQAVARGRRRRSLSVTLGGTVGLLLALAAASADAPQVLVDVLLLAGAASLVVGFVLGAGRSLVKGRVEPSGRWIALADVHPSFAAAVDAQTRAG